MKTLNWIRAVLFALFAAVQYNDPDPFGWIAVYGAVAALCALGAMGRAPRWALLAVAIVVLIWMVTLAPGMLDWARMGFPSIVGSNLFLQNWILLYFMSGTSILIVVGVALDLVEKVNAMLIMRNYEGFMKESSPGAAGGWGRQASVK